MQSKLNLSKGWRATQNPFFRSWLVGCRRACPACTLLVKHQSRAGLRVLLRNLRESEAAEVREVFGDGLRDGMATSE